MEQRAPRLGDIVDDYCPRERRITNHAIVAIVEDAIRQTRCTTCDAEHVFKQGREPRKRKSDSAFEQVLADVTGERSAPRAAEPAPPSAPVLAVPPAPAQPVDPVPPVETGSQAAAAPSLDDTWSAHRRLIRASLPKIDGEIPVPRPIPEFTMHQRPTGRGGRPFRHGSDHEINGNVMNAGGHGRDDRRGRMFHGNGHINGHGNGSGNGHGGRSHGADFGSGGDRPGGHGRPGRRRGRHKRGQ